MYCRKCGAPQLDGARYCSSCGVNLLEANTAPTGAAPAVYLDYAGFWRRFAAIIIDWIILNVLSLGINAVTGLGNSAADSATDIEIYTYFFSTNFLMYFGISIFATILYYGLFESSPLQATPGKMALSIKVTDMNGNRVSIGRAIGRYLGKILSSLILGIGYLMIAFTEKKQGLHDIMAETLVIKK
jgi:uncharacterized RDD family membrane protein YckC